MNKPPTYDKEILALYSKNVSCQTDFLDLIRGGDTWYHTGYKLKPSWWNWLKMPLGIEEYIETGYWYWKDDRTEAAWLKTSEGYWIWNVSSDFKTPTIVG